MSIKFYTFGEFSATEFYFRRRRILLVDLFEAIHLFVILILCKYSLNFSSPDSEYINLKVTNNLFTCMIKQN